MSQQPYRPDAPIAVCRDFFIKSKSICTDPQDSSPRNMTLCRRRRATGKGIGCVFIERKDKSFVSNCRGFRREMFLFSDPANGKTKTRGLFFDLPLVSLIAPPLSPVALLLWGKIGSCFLAPLGVRSVSGPSPGAPSHAGTRTRALRTQQVSPFLPSPLICNLLSNCSLGVKAFAFPLSSPEGEGSLPKPSPTKRCCSIICAHRVKR